MNCRAAVGILAIAWVLLSVTQARAMESARWDPVRHLLETPGLIGDPGGARGRLERLGVMLQLFYNQYLSGKPGGGGVTP